VRWNSYAVLALDLLWGRDIREFCAEQGYASAELNQVLDERLCEDFISFRHHCFSAASEQPRLRIALRELYELIKTCLNWRLGEMDGDFYEGFVNAWGKLDQPSFHEYLPINHEEGRFRKENGWENEFYRPGAPAPSYDGEESEFLICDYEETLERQTANGPRRLGRYKVVNLAHPARRRSELRKLNLDTLPVRGNYFLPGDIVPGVVRQAANGLARVEPADWTKPDPRYRPEIGQRMRALSLGRRWASFGPNVPTPLALVEIDGALRTFRIRPPLSQRWTIYPSPGHFFVAEFLEDGQHGFGVVPDRLPDPVQLLGQQFFRPVREVEQGRVFFDLPLGTGYFVSCMLPLEMCPVEQIQPGEIIPVRVDRIESGSILTRWDQRLAIEQAAVGARYSGTFVRRKAGDNQVEVQFGQRQQFVGVIEARNPAFPWGVPFRSWQPGRPLNVEVIGERSEGTRLSYHLHYLDDRPAPRPVDQVFRPGEIRQGTVLSCSDAKGVYVLLGDGEGDGLIQAEGLIPYSSLLKREQSDLRGSYPKGTSVQVVVREVDPARRQLILARHY
jgi:hypothetical protein